MQHPSEKRSAHILLAATGDNLQHPLQRILLHQHLLSPIGPIGPQGSWGLALQTSELKHLRLVGRSVLTYVLALSFHAASPAVHCQLNSMRLLYPCIKCGSTDILTQAVLQQSKCPSLLNCYSSLVKSKWQAPKQLPISSHSSNCQKALGL